MAPTPTITRAVFAEEVRGFMRDHPALNRLIVGNESSNRMIDYCMTLAIDEWNTTPPQDARAFETFPSRVILLYLTIVHLLFSVSLLKTRNRLRYVDGGWSSDPESQAEDYLRMIQMIRSQIAPQMMSLKVSNNIENAWGGGVSSEYAWINTWYGYT